MNEIIIVRAPSSRAQQVKEEKNPLVVKSDDKALIQSSMKVESLTNARLIEPEELDLLITRMKALE